MVPVFQLGPSTDLLRLPRGLATSNGSFTRISAGSATCAVRHDGSVLCWGGDYDGEADAPGTNVAGRFTQISAGEGLSCGVTVKHKVVCWGDVYGTFDPDEGS